MTRRTWKRLHYVAYAAAIFFFAHSLFSDLTLNGNPVDRLDGEKVYIEMCALAVAATTAWRVRWMVRHAQARRSHRERLSSIESLTVN